jgi:hypothetical protein
MKETLKKDTESHLVPSEPTLENIKQLVRQLKLLGVELCGYDIVSPYGGNLLKPKKH